MKIAKNLNCFQKVCRSAQKHLFNQVQSLSSFSNPFLLSLPFFVFLFPNCEFSCTFLLYLASIVADPRRDYCWSSKNCFDNQNNLKTHLENIQNSWFWYLSPAGWFLYVYINDFSCNIFEHLGLEQEIVTLKPPATVDPNSNRIRRILKVDRWTVSCSHFLSKYGRLNTWTNLDLCIFTFFTTSDSSAYCNDKELQEVVQFSCSEWAIGTTAASLSRQWPLLQKLSPPFC